MAAKLSLVLVIACTLYVHAFAQSGCTATIVSQLAPCLSYITGNSSTPGSSCCSGLDNVVKTQPQCLCQVIGPNAGSSIGITVNQTQAMALPAACNVKTPSPTLCSSISGGSPTASPSTPTTAPPSSVLPSPPSAANSPPATTTGTSPSVTPPTNGGPMNSAPSLMALAIVFLISCASSAGSF
ncbi:non-specific lipid transfer protein GPI-anchored 19-like [Nymphaea colorata]|nr:non-specific lipid transfer protein GPI-anchored 19-like [Nymphaea colorata]